MPEQYLNIPKRIVRVGGSLASGGNNPGAELTLVDLGKKGFVLQVASVLVIEADPQDDLIVSMAVMSPNPARPSVPPVLISTLHVPITQSGKLSANGAGKYVGMMQGPIPIKPGEKLVFQVQRRVGPGTFTFHAHAWGFTLP